ncbi:MAG: alpha-1,4-glucan--maltose-1-phosphate maltosyltransferase [Pseudomonas sp.]|uniref:alpha-1,4-glucan--maltose-1-phosphate maltosyltransferase n=1 Tax=Pseudomonas sp. TaxID=306 RepID=UPI003399DB07
MAFSALGNSTYPDAGSPSDPLTQALSQPRIVIEATSPVIDEGRFATKALIGQSLQVNTTLYADGHDQLGAELLWCEAGSQAWQALPLTALGNDRWQAQFTPMRLGRHRYVIQAWWDVFGTYRYELQKKHAAGVDVTLEIREGQLHLQTALANLAHDAPSGAFLRDLQGQLSSVNDLDEQVGLLLSPALAQVMAELDARPHRVRSPEYPVEVERERAQFASWYELFPRSQTSDPSRHGTFADVAQRLADIRDMGFDVLYFPPIHPIGRAHRKGPNNCLVAGPDDPGSPYAIGSEDGGHDAIHPQLGSREDFRQLVRQAREHGLEIALDFAIQCSQDHPWLNEHPGWFSWRPDGSIRYAENPPKKYQDIVNVDFYAEQAMPDLWLALRDIVQGWVDEGVKIFRVDNPHTKPLPFWEWLIADVRGRDPEVMFLAEAFTRPAMMARLGKVGYSQSYTYFTWRNTKAELSEYFTLLNQAPWRDCYRPNFFVNTPDINPFFLHDSGRAGFLIRAVLATMGSGLWGMYSGFELCEAAAIPGKEEYLDSEKYQIRPRDYRAPGNIVGEIALLNRIRRQNPALQTHLGFVPYNAWNDQVLLFGKRTADLGNFILVAVNLDPHHAQDAAFELPLWEFGLPDHGALDGEDLMTGHRWTWHGKIQHLHLDTAQPFGIWRIKPALEHF